MNVLVLLLACTGDGNKNQDKTPTDSPPVDSVDSEPQGCGTARGQVDPSWELLRFDDGELFSDASRQSWELDGEKLKKAVLNESVRFELDRPARVHGFQIVYANVPEGEDPAREIEAGLYPDFGYNGFDHWHPDPYWTGTRCMEDIVDGEPVDYLLDEAVELDHPGLIYVTRQRTGNPDLSVYFDGSPADDDCASFDSCSSAMNTPELGTSQYYNGYTFPFAYDYLIRLYVEYLEEGPDTEVFEDVTGDLSVGSRMAWGDYDNDGRDDLLTNNRLYHNTSEGWVLAQESWGSQSVSGGVWGDADNDGCLDLFLFAETTRAGDSLWMGDCAGGFTDVTEQAGIDDVQDYNLCNDDPEENHAPSPAAAWWDVDSDGDLDLYVVGFICWTEYSYYKDQLFLNDGQANFTLVEPGDRGLMSGAYSGRGASPIDADGDGDVDLFVNNYTLHRNIYYESLAADGGEDLVDEEASQSDLDGVKVSGAYGHSIGAAWGDLDNDGDFDVIEANLAHPRYWTFSDKTRVMLNDGAGAFVDKQGSWDGGPYSNESGLRYQETHSVPVLADFDQDGALDLVISAVYDGRPTDFYWGQGDGTFVLDAYHAGIDKENGWGVASSDFDNDGDADLSISSYLYANTAAEGHWVQVRALGGIDTNWGAYGATVRVVTAEQTWMRHVQGGSGQGCQDSAYVHVGLGEVSTIDRIEVDYPGGGTVLFEGPFEADQRIWVMEDGSTATGWSWPE